MPAASTAALFRSRGPLPAEPALPRCSRPLPPRGCSGPDALRPPPRGLRAPWARRCEGAAGGGATRNSRCPGPARSPSRASKIACAILELPPPGESERGYASIVRTAAGSEPPGGAQEPAPKPLPRKQLSPPSGHRLSPRVVPILHRHTSGARTSPPNVDTDPSCVTHTPLSLHTGFSKVATSTHLTGIACHKDTPYLATVPRRLESSLLERLSSVLGLNSSVYVKFPRGSS